jgi:hypothetical protein
MHGAGNPHIIDKADRGYPARLDHIAAYNISHREKSHTTRSAHGYDQRGYLYVEGKTNCKDSEQSSTRDTLPKEKTYHP